MPSLAINRLTLSFGLLVMTSLASAGGLVKGSDPAAKPIKEAVARLVKAIETGSRSKAEAEYAGEGVDRELLKGDSSRGGAELRMISRGGAKAQRREAAHGGSMNGRTSAVLSASSRLCVRHVFSGWRFLTQRRKGAEKRGHRRVSME